MTIKRMHVVIELDEVLADIEHRRDESIPSHIQSLIRGDRLHYMASRVLLGFIRSGMEIVIVAPQRSATYTRETRVWLKESGISYDYIIFDATTAALQRLEKDGLSGSTFMGCMCKSAEFVSYAKKHLHRPLVLGVMN